MSNVGHSTPRKSPEPVRAERRWSPKETPGLASKPERSVHCAVMFDHLVQFEPEITSPEPFEHVDDVSASDMLDAQLETAKWLETLGETPPPDEAEYHRAAARDAFVAMASQNDDVMAKRQLALLRAPEAVRTVVGMLSAYDWEFVEQAKELRGYVVTKLIEETENPRPQIRLKALELIGKITEVGLFTERIEIKKTDLSDADLEARIKEKLNRFAGVIDVQDAREVLPSAQNAPSSDSNTIPEPARAADA